MKVTKFLTGGIAAFVLTAGAAFAQVVVTPNPLSLDPALSEAGFAHETVCDGPGFPACANAALNGPSSYSVTFENPGFFSSSISPSVVDTGSNNPNAEFTTLNYTIFDPSNTAVLSNITGQSNLAVVAGTYTIQVNWTFAGSPTASSANWAMPLTTGPGRLVPEPGTLALLGLGLAALAIGRRKKA